MGKIFLLILSIMGFLVILFYSIDSFEWKLIAMFSVIVFYFCIKDNEDSIEDNEDDFI